MRVFRVLRMWLRTLFRRQIADAELDAEIQFHVEQQMEENVSLGMTPSEARYAALRTTGSLARVKEQCREARGINWIENLVIDVRYALRALRNSPGFAAAVDL